MLKRLLSALRGQVLRKQVLRGQVRARAVKLSALLLGLWLCTACQSASAWAAPVHVVICEMAWLQLTPAAKRLVREIRAGDRAEADSFAASCVWPDTVRATEYRDTYEYHFVNLAQGANGFDPARDCAAFDCVPLAVHRYLQYVVELSPSARMRLRRAAALRFLGHFVADLHQPLHVGYADDRGGNTISVQWRGKRTNLHALFDGELPAAVGVTRARAAARLVRAIDPTRAAQWRQGDVAAWASESFVLARDLAYPVARDGQVDAREQRQLEPMLHEQVQKASVRLAWVLNEAALRRFALRPLW